MRTQLASKFARFSSLALTVSALFVTGCSKVSDTSSAIFTPTGTVLSGATLAGPLAGKQLYLMSSPVNPTNCWIDSQYWTGTELFFGISSLDYTALNNGTVFYNSACSPSPAFTAQSSPGTTGNFNIYRATLGSSDWVLTNVTLNLNQTVSIAAPKTGGTRIAFVKYEKTSSAGNIYISTRTGDNAFSTPIAFSQNSANCSDDNPSFFNNGNQMIFTSSRTVASGASCSGSSKKTFWSSTWDGSTWSTPTAITGAPATATNSVDQAWVDSTNAKLYWTATGTDCAGTAELCIMSATGSGTNWSSNVQQIATPLNVTTWPTTNTPFVSLIGQYTSGNGYAFVACGITTFVGSSSSTGLTTLNGKSVSAGVNGTGGLTNYYHTDIQTCFIQL